MISNTIKKMISLGMIASMMLSAASATVFAEDYGTGAEPGMEITSEGIALGLYGSKTSDSEAGLSKHSAKTQTVNPVAAMVQSYIKKDGSFALNKNSRFVIAESNRPSDPLLNAVRLMNVEYAAAEIPTENVLPVVYANEKFARAGDIIIKLVDPSVLETSLESADVDQQYTMDIGDKVEIQAATPQGVNYALITLMELALNEGGSEGQVELQASSIVDGPDAKERTIFLDCGRKYFSKEYIKNLIRRSAMQKYNAIELHFSEAEGLRLDSNVFPWLTEDNKSLTREEMVEIVELARTYNMEVIPSIDVPGHNEYIVKQYAKYVKKHPDFEFTYMGRTFNKKDKGFESIANHYSYNGKIKKADYIGIDITKDHAVSFMDALIDDYAQFFLSLGCTKFDLGGDEVFGWYNFSLGGKDFDYSNRWQSVQHWERFAKKQLGIKKGSASDTFIYYLNHIDERLHASGITCRVFSDEININKNQHIKLNKDIDVIFWYSGAGNFGSISDEGHTMLNDMEYWVYYVVRQQDGDDIMSSKYKSVNAENIFRNWQPQEIKTKSGKIKKIPDDLYAGGYFNIWCDTPDYKTPGKIWTETEMRTWANAAKLWNADVSTSKSGAGAPLTYAGFEKFVKRLGVFPGFSHSCNAEVKLPEPAELENSAGILDFLKGMIGIE